MLWIPRGPLFDILRWGHTKVIIGGSVFLFQTLSQAITGIDASNYS